MFQSYEILRVKLEVCPVKKFKLGNFFKFMCYDEQAQPNDYSTPLTIPSNLPSYLYQLSQYSDPHPQLMRVETRFDSDNQMNKGELKPIFEFGFVRSDATSCGVANYKNYYVFTEDEIVSVCHFNLRTKKILRKVQFELPLPFDLVDDDESEYEIIQVELAIG